MCNKETIIYASASYCWHEDWQQEGAEPWQGTMVRWGHSHQPIKSGGYWFDREENASEEKVNNIKRSVINLIIIVIISSIMTMGIMAIPHHGPIDKPSPMGIVEGDVSIRG